MKSVIRFENEKLKLSYKESEHDNPKLFKHLNNALVRIENNAFCGVQIPKRLFPRKWLVYSNLWKFNLLEAWRLIYTIAPPEKEGEIIVLAIVLDWTSHKEYEKIFKY